MPHCGYVIIMIQIKAGIYHRDYNNLQQNTSVLYPLYYVYLKSVDFSKLPSYNYLSKLPLYIVVLLRPHALRQYRTSDNGGPWLPSDVAVSSSKGTITQL